MKKEHESVEDNYDYKQGNHRELILIKAIQISIIHLPFDKKLFQTSNEHQYAGTKAKL